MAAPLSTTLFKPGRNCYRAVRCDRAALLIDGAAYFRAFAQAALRATRSIVIVGWDFHSQTRLHLDMQGVPDLLGDFLNFLIRRNRRLRIFILVWDSPLLFGAGRELPAGSDGSWQPHRRIDCCYDSTGPLGAALHQKIVVIDGAVGFCGGMDLTVGRWDTPAHACNDPRRSNGGEAQPYGPVHDTMLAVDSEAARVLQGVASERWRGATGKALPSAYALSDPWPASVPVMFSDVSVALARTVPAGATQQAVTEVEALYLDMIAAARRYIYLENQYFTAKSLGEALAARLAEPQGPEVVVVSRLASSGWLEAPAMAALRSVLLRKLRDADRYGRFSAWYPDTPGDSGCDVHSKLMIVDDEWLRVGSANFASRSMGLDTECDLAVEAGGDSRKRAAIASARNTLLAEHLGVAVQDFEDAPKAAHSLAATIETFGKTSGRTLRGFERLDEASPAMIALANGVADPGQPISMDELMSGFIPGMAHAAAERAHPRQGGSSAAAPWLPGCATVSAAHSVRGRRDDRDVLAVGSYNIHGCVGTDARHDYKRVAGVIRELGCDTVGLQEVDGRLGVGSASMQLQQLASATGMTPIAACTHIVTPLRVRKTNALLTFREVRHVRSYDLTFESREPRSALDVELLVGGRVVRVIVTHLGLHASERRYQVKKLTAVLGRIPEEQPVVVLGDINEWWPVGRPLRWMHGALGKAPSVRSFPVWAPLLALDRIWSRAPSALVTIAVHRSPAARRASDHYPVKANIVLDPGRAKAGAAARTAPVEAAAAQTTTQPRQRGP